MYRLMSGHFSFKITLSELVYNILSPGYNCRFTHCHFHGEMQTEIVSQTYCTVDVDFKSIPSLFQNFKGFSLIHIKAITHEHFKTEWEKKFPLPREMVWMQIHLNIDMNR